MTEEFDLDTQREMAQRMFPVAWAKSLTVDARLRGKKQANLRKRAVSDTIIARLRAAGHSCSTCKHYEASRQLGRKEMVCGYNDNETAVPPDHLCTDFKALASAPTS